MTPGDWLRLGIIVVIMYIIATERSMDVFTVQNKALIYTLNMYGTLFILDASPAGRV